MSMKSWIIHKLGGYTRREWTETMRMKAGAPIVSPTTLHPQCVKACYGYYVQPDTEEVRRAQEQMARNELAKKIALEMLEHGLIRVINTVDPVQDRAPIKKYRMTAAAWALDATQMPFYGGCAP